LSYFSHKNEERNTNLLQGKPTTKEHRRLRCFQVRYLRPSSGFSVEARLRNYYPQARKDASVTLVWEIYF
jgi:hypothetical protein